MIRPSRPLLLEFLFTVSFSSMVYPQEPADSIRYHLPAVTAIGTRLSHAWFETPLALSIIPRNDLRLIRGYGLEEALSGVPGVLALSRTGNQDIRIIIRGFGARGAGERSNSGTSRGLRILSDGFPETEPDGRTAFDLADISGAGSVEVVRSNFSSVWGNAAGGVVNIRSNTSFESPFAEFTSFAGSFGFHKELFHAGTRLETGNLSIVASNTNVDGWRWHSQSSLTLFKVALISRPGDRTSLGVYLTGASNLFRIPGPLTDLQYESNAQQADSLYIKRDERRFNRLGRIGVTLSQEFGNGHGISASAFINPKYLQRSERNTFRDFNRYHVGGNLMYRNEHTFGDRFNNSFLVGMDEAYQDGSILFYNLTPDGGRGSTLTDNKREGANNFGMFLQDEIQLGSDWSFLAGLRYDEVVYYAQSFVKPWLNDARSFTHITPKAGITFRLSPTHSLYANIGGGVEVPAGNETDPVPPDTVHALNLLLDPILSTTFEVGTKQLMTLGDGTLRGSLVYDIALYWIEVKNDIIPYRNGRFYVTAGRTRRLGGELGVTVRLENGLSLDGSLTLSNNRYIEYRVDSVYYSASKAGMTADYANNEVAGIPSAFFTFSAKYSPLSMPAAYIRLGLQGISRYFVDDPNRVSVPAWTTVNAGIGFDRYMPGKTGLFLSAFFGMQNFANARYIGSAWINPDQNAQGKPMYIEPGLPRNIVGSITVGMNF